MQTSLKSFITASETLLNAEHVRPWRHRGAIPSLCLFQVVEALMIGDPGPLASRTWTSCHACIGVPIIENFTDLKPPFSIGIVCSWRRCMLRRLRGYLPLVSYMSSHGTAMTRNPDPCNTTSSDRHNQGRNQAQEFGLLPVRTVGQEVAGEGSTNNESSKPRYFLRRHAQESGRIAQ